MARFAIVGPDGIVKNVIDAPTEFEDPYLTLIPCDETVGRGDYWDGTTFTKVFDAVIDAIL